jgi:DNA-binding NtrC family response regulator
MNAPWKPATLGVRDPFVAYVCDDTTVETLRPVIAELGWAVEKICKGGLRNAVQTLSVSASPQILFVDLAESGDPLNDINSLAEVCEPGTVVIAAGQVNDVRLYRDLLASGIQDYLLKPLHPDMLRETFTQAQAMLSAPQADRPDRRSPALRDRGHRCAGRCRCIDDRDFARLAALHQGEPDHGAARPRRPLRHGRARARPGARPRPDRRDREPEPHRRTFH